MKEETYFQTPPLVRGDQRVLGPMFVTRPMSMMDPNGSNMLSGIDLASLCLAKSTYKLCS